MSARVEQTPAVFAASRSGRRSDRYGLMGLPPLQSPPELRHTTSKGKNAR